MVGSLTIFIMTLQHVSSIGLLLLFIFLLELQLTDLWKEIDGMQTPELRHLAERLIGTVLKSRANATTKKYLGA